MPVDVISFGETMLRLTAPEGLRLHATPELRVNVAGTESNTLACLARLGLQTLWLSALPEQPLGRHIEAELRAHGVDTRHVQWLPDTVRVGIFYVEEAPPPLGTQVYYDRAHSACALVDPEAVDYALINGARLLHLTGITPALSEQAKTVFQRCLERARAADVPLSFDVNYRAKLWTAQEAALNIEEACRQATLLFCTRADAAELWGMTGAPEAVLRQMAQRFADDNPQKTIVLTLGNEGAAQWRAGLYQAEPGLTTTGTMRFGSGDAFAAGYLYAHLDGPLFHALRSADPARELTALTFGNALAALKRCIAGDIAIVTPDDVHRALASGTIARFR